MCAQGKLEGSIQIGREWFIPRSTPKPIDGRTRAGKAHTDVDMPLPRKTPFLAKKVLGEKDTELEGKIQTANETLEAARKSLQEQIDALKADIESAMRSISAVNTQTTDLINSHIAKLNAAIAAAEKAATDADTALKAELEDKIDGLETFVIIVCVIAGVSLA